MSGGEVDKKSGGRREFFGMMEMFCNLSKLTELYVH